MTELTLGIATLVIGAISAIVGALWRRIEKLDDSNDQLRERVGELRAENVQLKAAQQKADRETENLRLDLEAEKRARERDRIDAARKIEELVKENAVLRHTLRSHGIRVEDKGDTP